MITTLRALLVVLCLCRVGTAAESGHLSFTMSTTVADNQTVTVEVAYPLGADGKPTAEARDIAYYAPYWCEEKFADGGVFAAMAAHFTVVGIFLDDRKLPQGSVRSTDPASGSLAAIQAAIEETRKRLQLPAGKAFACGHSSGASLLYWAVREKPEVFEAIAPIAGYAPDIRTAPQVPTLHVATFGDNNLVSSLAWHRMQNVGGWSSMLTTDPRWEARDNPIWLHLNSDASITLAVAWLRGVADLRAAHGGVLPAPRDWPVQVAAERVAATGESKAKGMRAFPNTALAERFTAVHRRVETVVDQTSGLRVARVTPLAGADRTVFVLVDPARKAEMALYDAVLIAGKGADAIAVQATRSAGAAHAVATLIATEQARHPERPCLVIAEAAASAALAALPANVVKVVVDPRAPLAPGTTAVVAAEGAPPAGAIAVAGPFSSPEVRRQQLLAAACTVAQR